MKIPASGRLALPDSTDRRHDELATCRAWRRRPGDGSPGGGPTSPLRERHRECGQIQNDRSLASSGAQLLLPGGTGRGGPHRHHAGVRGDPHVPGARAGRATPRGPAGLSQRLTRERSRGEPALLIRAKCAPHSAGPLRDHPAAPREHARLPPRRKTAASRRLTSRRALHAGGGREFEIGLPAVEAGLPRTSHGPLGGRCGACDSVRSAAGAAPRHATYGDYLAEDPPAATGAAYARADPPRSGRDCSGERFPRGAAPRQFTTPARPAMRCRRWRCSEGQVCVTPALLAEVRSRWGISPGRPFTPATGRPPAAGGG